MAAHYSPLGSGERGYNLFVARRRLNDAYIRDLFEVWKRKGIQILEQVAREQPGTFMKCMTQLMPRELKVENTQTIVGSLPDETLHNMIAELQQRIEAKLSGDQAKVINGEAAQALPKLQKLWRPRRTRKAAKALKAITADCDK
jgi:hypothetical protein